MSFSASSLVRAAAWDSVGGPNPRLYPNQNVDVDLGLRLAAADWSVLVARDSLVRHVRNASTPAHKLRYLLIRNHRKLMRDHRQLLSERPPTFESAGAVDAWLAHLAVLAARRRTRVPPPRTARPATPLPTLVRDARSDARRVRIGEALLPLRVGLYRARRSMLRWFRRIRRAGG
jgi:GT2 family glycosyltransferase